MGASSKITQKYQITIPKEIRKEWGVKAGDTVIFKNESSGVKVETMDEFFKKYVGMFKEEGSHSVRDMRKARKTMFIRNMYRK